MGGGGSGIAGYSYTAAIIAGLANGPIAGIGSVWSNKDRITLDSLNMIVKLGLMDQTPWGYIETKHPSEALNYPGLAYVATPEIALGRSSAELPNLSFEVFGRGMSKTVLDPGGVAIWDPAPFYLYHAVDDYGYLPQFIASPNDENGAVGLFARIIFTGPATVSVEVNASYTVTVASGEAFSISGAPITQFNITSADTSLNVSGIDFSTAVTPEIAIYDSSVPGKLDEDPAIIIADFLTNTVDGAGLPSSKLGDLTNYSDYCVAANLLLSPAFSEQKAAAEHLKDLLAATNSEAVPSQGLLKIIPYGDAPLSGNGRTYVPDMTPLYYFDDNHFLSSGEDPVVGSRVTSADAFNHVQIEFVNRLKDYNVEIAEAKDQADNEEKGLRTMDVVQMHHICDPEVAQTAAQLLLQRTLYVRNTYKFKLSWNYPLLEPMDIVAITDAGLGLDRTPVRIKLIEEDDEDRLEFTVEEIPPGVSTAQDRTPPPASGWISDAQTDPGDALTPFFYEPPDILCASPTRPELWIAATGGPDWGGCEAWISTNGESFASIGFIYGKPKLGVLSASLATIAGTPPVADTAHTLSVTLHEGSPGLFPGNQQDADTFQTLCYVGGELIAYRDALLAATDSYNLTYLVRGCHGSTIAAHSAGAQFCRLDNNILKFVYPEALVGHEVFIKLTSFNLYGKRKQSLADVATY
ncbi:hypothetical protein CCP3SC15_360034 [Gammaproteobacteria bacterium]